MNKSIAFIFFLFFALPAFSQYSYPYEEIRLNKPADYKNAEPFALSAANFLLNNPFKKDDAERERALKFLTTWGAGDRDYHFELTGVINELADDRDLMSIYIPGMVKFCLENKTLGSNTAVIANAAIKTVLDYANNPANSFTLKKKARKKLEAN